MQVLVTRALRFNELTWCIIGPRGSILPYRSKKYSILIKFFKQRNYCLENFITAPLSESSTFGINLPRNSIYIYKQKQCRIENCCHINGGINYILVNHDSKIILLVNLQEQL